MKTIKQQKEESNLDRHLISKFGESLYHFPEVRAVFIKVHFKDGSAISFRRDEDQDTLDSLFNEINEEEEK